MQKDADDLRSARWFKDDNLRNFSHRSRMMQLGYSEEEFLGKAIIGVLNTWSELNTCHSHFPERVKNIKRGIAQAGGFAVELPVLSVDEIFTKPSSMLYRNLLAMETEEVIRSHPVDGVVLMGGCDKTTPGLIMGAISAGLPFIFVPAGAMLRGNYAGQILGSGVDLWKFWDERRAGKVSEQEWAGIKAGLSRSAGTCMTMGTASTMMSIADAMGLTLPGASSIPAPDSGHSRMCTTSGQRVVDMVWEDMTPDKIILPAAMKNASIVAMAIGGSTNAAVHLIAIARRAGIDLSLDDLDKLSRITPLIANIQPSGKQYLMEDFFYAGGLCALMRELGDLLDGSCITVNGKTVQQNVKDAKVYNSDVIRPLTNPVYEAGSLAVLRGNLCPDGAIIKPAACNPKFYQHQGPALVFDSYAEMSAAVKDEHLDVTAQHVLVLRNAGPQGGPGFPEWGMLPIPQVLLKQGYRDMLRISDARMSGTSYGACILHVAPESYVGGPLALLQTGDLVRFDLQARRLDMLVDDAELEKRRSEWQAPPPRFERGYGYMFAQHVTQADKGCDFDCLERSFGKKVGEPDIF